MPPRPRDRARPLGLIDLILIVAMAAVWAAWARSFAVGFWGGQSIWFLGEGGIVFLLKHQGGYALILASLTMLVIRLRAPRPSRRRLWRQPGLVASAGATVGFLVGLAGATVRWATTPDPRTLPPSMGGPMPIEIDLFELAEPYAGPGVAGAWLALFLTRRWRSERGAIDRLGQGIGVLWLVEFFMAEMPMTRCWIAIVNATIRWGSR